jgi:hypothetical protein
LVADPQIIRTPERCREERWVLEKEGSMRVIHNLKKKKEVVPGKSFSGECSTWNIVGEGFSSALLRDLRRVDKA